ncbi:uncharacterized protein LOC122081146 [Macadamia integrifolia]|uniref:uncharacterized protein LOC122081146 n=1 Tax=Macadamia integrifolia TaxID=60698 RepID=UPI001C4E7F1E|nr:uncharacterized protein LOC122081146 [Macadamia integrifolia]
MRFCFPTMGNKQKFQQQWELRRRDVSPSDSSTNESESSSREEPILKKHKLISDWVSLKADEGGSITRSQPKARNAPSMGNHHEVEKAKKTESRLCKKGRHDKIKEMPFCEEESKRKSHSCADEPVTLEGTRIFMESILEELRVARENLLIWMREEMHKVLNDESASGPNLSENNYKQQISGVQHQNSFESDSQNQIAGTVVGSTKRRRTVNSRKRNEFPADQSDYWQTIESMNAIETEREGRREPSAKGSSSLFSGEVGSTSLTPAAVIPGACNDSLRLDSSPCSYTQTRMVENRMGLDTVNPMLDSRMHHRSLLGSQEETYENVAYMGSQDQNRFTPPSRFGTGFPVPLLHGFGAAFKTQTQASSLKQSQVQSRKIVLSMDGVGMRLPVGGSHGLPDFHDSSDLHLDSKVSGDAWTPGNSMP